MSGGSRIQETRPNPVFQRGSALVVSLLILMVMTVIGITAMGSTTLEERMANNNRQRQVAFQSAEAALRDAETFLATSITNVASLSLFNGTTPGLYTQRIPVVGMSPIAPAPAFNIYDDTAWTAGNSMLPTVALGSVTRQPRYIIEYMGRVGEPPLDYTVPDTRQYAFRVTALAWGEGANPTSRYLAWSSFRIPLN